MVLILPCALNAQISLSFDAIDTPNDSSVTVVASIADSSDSGVSLTTYNIPVDIGLDGSGIPAGVSNVALANASSFGNFDSPAVPSVFNYDFITSDSGASGLALSSIPTELFTVTFDVDSGVAAGTVFDVGFQADPQVQGLSNPSLFNFTITDAGGAINFNGGAPPAEFDFAIENGTVSVVAEAVPEPSSFVLAAFGLGGLVLRRRRC